MGERIYSLKEHAISQEHLTQNDKYKLQNHSYLLAEVRVLGNMAQVHFSIYFGKHFRYFLRFLIMTRIAINILYIFWYTNARISLSQISVDGFLQSQYVIIQLYKTILYCFLRFLHQIFMHFYCVYICACVFV